MCIYFGSKSKRDLKMDEVMYLYVTEKYVVSQLYDSYVPQDLLHLFSVG